MKKNKIRINQIDTFLFVAFLFLFQIYQGLYYRDQYIPAIIFIGVLFSYYMYINFTEQGFVFIDNILDLVLGAYIISYIINCFLGIDKMSSFDGLLKAMGLFMIYKISYQLYKKNSKATLDIFGFIGFGLAGISILGAANIIKMDALFIDVTRLAGPYQYPNTFAAILTAFFLLNLIKQIRIQNVNIKATYIFFQIMTMICIYETKSRGTFIILLIVWLIQLIFVSNKDKYIYIIETVLVILFSLFEQLVFTKITSPLYFIGFILFYAVVAYILALGLVKFKNVFNKAKGRNIRYYLIGGLSLALILVIVILNVKEPLRLSGASKSTRYEIYNVNKSKEYVMNIDGNCSNLPLEVSVISNNVVNEKSIIVARRFIGENKINSSIGFKTLGDTSYIIVQFTNLSSKTGIEVKNCVIKTLDNFKIIKKVNLKYKFLSLDMTQKLSEINIKSGTAMERLTFVKDGLNMWKDFFLFGGGENSWSKLFWKYRSYNYMSKNPHNFIIQTAVESGLLGIIILFAILAIIIRVLRYCLKTKQTEANARVLGIGTFLATVLLHSLIDVDMMFFSIKIISFAAIGFLMAEGFNLNNIKVNIKKQMLIRILAVLICIITTGFSIFLFSGMKDGQNGADNLGKDNGMSAFYYSRAMSKDFLNVSYIMDVNKIILEEGYNQKRQDLYNRALGYYRMALKLDGYNIDIYKELINFYLGYGLYYDCIEMSNKLIAEDPISPINYEKSAIAINTIVDFARKTKDSKLLNVAIKNMKGLKLTYLDNLKKHDYHFELTNKTIEIINKVVEQN